jgi:hypothetical protein
MPSRQPLKVMVFWMILLPFNRIVAIDHAGDAFSWTSSAHTQYEPLISDPPDSGRLGRSSWLGGV